MAAQDRLLGVDGDLLAHRDGDGAVHGDLVPRPGQVDLPPVPVGDDGASGGPRRVDHELAQQHSHRVVGAVGLIGLQQRVLGRVRGVDALVPERTTDLVDLLQPTDDAALQVQLRRYAQRHLDVQGVEVRPERARRRTAVHRLQDGRLHLEIAETVEGLPQRAQHRGLGPDHLAGLGPDEEVDVASAHPGVLGHVLVQGGQRTQRLRRQLPRGRHHRQLTAPAAHHLTGDGHQVTEVDVRLPRRQRLLADLVEAQHDLQPVVAFLQRGEAQLACAPQVHHAAADGHRVAAARPVRQPGPALVRPDLGE